MWIFQKYHMKWHEQCEIRKHWLKPLLKVEGGVQRTCLPSNGPDPPPPGPRRPSTFPCPLANGPPRLTDDDLDVEAPL